MIEWLVYLRGMWRIRWGNCPVCNSDAPDLDTCTYCHGFRGWRDKKLRAQMRFTWVEKCGRDWVRYWS